MNIQKQKKKSKGFTLIELLVVIAVIGILAAIIVPRFQGAATAAADAATTSSIAAANRILDAFEGMGGTYGSASTQLDNTNAGTLYADLLTGVTVNGVVFSLPVGAPTSLPSGWTLTTPTATNPARFTK